MFKKIITIHCWMIKNADKNFIIAPFHTFISSIGDMARGLMFSKPKTLVFGLGGSRRISLHMWFVFFPIDVSFLDQEFFVVEIKRVFKPWTFYSSKEACHYIIETPAGNIGSTVVGDRITVN